MENSPADHPLSPLPPPFARTAGKSALPPPTAPTLMGTPARAKVEPRLPVPDVAGAKYQHAVLAQPPEELTGLRLSAQQRIAAGVTAVLKSMEFNWGEAGVGRGTKALLALNQKDGYDCSSCAWPDPDTHRSIAEFCENGAKATASDADDKAAGPEFFAKRTAWPGCRA